MRCTMIRINGWVWVCVALGCLAIAGHAAAEFISPEALVADSAGKTLYAADVTSRQIAVYDVAGAAVTKNIALPEPPSGLALSADGATLYATCAAPAGHVYVIDVAAGTLGAAIPAGHTPMAPVLSPDGALLYVCSRFNNAITVVDLAAGNVAATIPVNREPVAAAITPDGKFLFVANHLPAGAGDGDYVSSTVSVIDTAARNVAATIALPNGSTDLRGLCIAPDGKNVYVTHILARYQLPTTQLERGWMNTNALSVVDVAAKKLVNTVLLDDVDLGAANPWGVACSPDGAYVCVCHAGTHEVSVIDRAAMHDKLTRVAAGEKVSSVSLTADDVPNDLSFLVGIRERKRLAGNGPRGLAIVGKTVYAAEYFTGALGLVNLDPEAIHRPKSVPLGEQQPMTEVRQGEIHANDANLCFQHWQSCASCHPDMRTDGLNWDLLNDGMGNPKSTKSLLLAHVTPPAMVSGIRGSAEIAVRAGIRHIQFAVRPEEDAKAIDAYFKSLTPVPSPYLENGQLSEAAKRGKEVFAKAECSLCHSGELYTDLQSYDVGTGIRREKGIALDTPTLIETWRTGPYLHDGRAATIKDMLTTHNPNDTHGVTKALTEQEIGDLAAFVLSL
jgi:YVTN family beta-propeller protein